MKYSCASKRNIGILLWIASNVVLTSQGFTAIPLQIPSYRKHNTLTSAALSKENELEQILLFRRACKRFKRFDGTDTSDKASVSDPGVIRQAAQALDLARLSPSSFNTQPYRLVLVKSLEQKQLVANACLGPNRQRVLDSDCTVVFLADKQVTRTLQRYRSWLKQHNKAPPRKVLRTIQVYITLFSSGYPLPRILSAPLGFAVRAAVSVVHWWSRLFHYFLPSLGSAETWTSRQTMLVAMTYMLACASRGIATIPMEGFNAMEVRRAVGASGRYAVPVVVATGTAYEPGNVLTREQRMEKERYPRDEIIFGDKIGNALAFPLSTS